MRRFLKNATGHRAAAAILLLYLLLATVYNLTNPLFESPDELLHYGFIRHLHQERRLPVVDLDGPLTEYHQPPLYYALAALVTAPLPDGELEAHTLINPFWGYEIGAVGDDNKNQYLHGPEQHFPFDSTTWAVHLTRALSTVFGCGTLALVYLLALRFVPQPLAAASTAIVAFTPNFLLTSGSITNDSLVILLSTASGLLIVDLAAKREPPSLTCLASLAALLGLGMLTKLSAWPLLPLSALAITLLALRLKSWRVFFVSGTILLAGVGLLGGWWALRNLRLYGDLTGLSSMWAVWGVREPLTLSTYLVELRYFRTTFWANFGYGNVPVAGWVYTLLDVTVVGGAVGLLVALVIRRGDPPRDPGLHDQIVILVVWAALTSVALIWYLQRTQAVTGRQLYPALPVIALGLVVGWSTFVPGRWRNHLAAAVAVLMLTFAVGAWLIALVPAYRPSPRLPAERADQAIAHRLDWQLGDAATLLGYTPSQEVVAPGGEVTVTLYWQPLGTPDRNYTIFLHLFGVDNAPVGGRDTYPGLGNDPTIYWRPGEIIEDAIPVRVTPDVEGPVLLDIEVGLYDLETGERLPVHDPAGNVVGYPVVGHIKLEGEGQAGVVPAHPLDITFEGGLTLSGYDLSTTTPRPGEPLTVTLYWAPSGPLAADYTVFAHLVDEAGDIVAQGDGPPRGGRYPTTAWAAGEHLADAHVIRLPSDAPPGTYHLLVGLYDAQSGARLPLVAGDDRVSLEEAIRIP
jgi:4-amino-4-deoxy-L-arabinose transferase-like glycosyltransferase